MRKSLFFVSTAVFLTALIIITGCKQVTNTNTITRPGRNSIYGTVSTAELQSVIDRVAASGETLFFEPGLSIGTGDVNLKNARIVVNGGMTNAALLNAAYASVSRNDKKATIINSGTYIYPKDTDHDWITGGTKAEFLPNGLSTMQATATHAAVREFKLGPIANMDYSTGVTVNPMDYSTNLTNIYVVDKLTIPADGQRPSFQGFTALGTVDVVENNTSALTAAGLKLAATSTLISSTGNVEITLPAAINLGTVKVEHGKNIIFKTGTTSPATITMERLTGTGTLIFDAVPTKVTINGGDSTIEFLRPITNASFTLKGEVAAIFDASVATSTFPAAADSSTGTVIFKSTAGFGTNPSAIRGDVVFNDNVTQNNAALSLLGNVSLKNGKKLTFYINKAITLGAGKNISVGEVPVLTVIDGNVEVTPKGMTTLTAGDTAPDVNPTDQQILNAKTLTLGGASLTITTGNLQVTQAGIFEIGPVTLSTSGAISTLSVAPGGTIVLVNKSASISTGTAVNDVIITGVGIATTRATPTTLKASGGTISMGDSMISGSAAGASTSLVLGGADSAVITSKNLVLNNVTLDLRDRGDLVIAMNTIAHSVKLKNQAKLFLIDHGVPNSSGYIKGGGDKFVAISGGYRSLGATDADGTAVHSIAHQAGLDMVVLRGHSAIGSATLNKAAAYFFASGQ
jgi:hypothetical protein